MTAKQLKSSILQMAVQGKLVPQNPADEPASVLLEKIRKERERLVKEGKIRADKNPSRIFRGGEVEGTEKGRFYERIGKGNIVDITDELPFEIPESWEWCRISTICNVARGGSPRPIKSFLTTAKDGINWIKIGDTKKNSKYIFQTKEKIISSAISKSRFVKKGDLLLTNSMSFGRPYILQIDGCIHDGWLILEDFQAAANVDYLYFCLLSSVLYKQFLDKISGAVVKNLNIEKVKSSFIPLSPYEEQQRIASKISELLPQISAYEQAESALIELNSKFPINLKKSILQAAIQGRLVPQDPSDEPASVLLEKIRAERKKLIVEGKIKKPKMVRSCFHKALILHNLA